MTREEAIEFLNTDDYESKGYNDAVGMAIEALKEMSVEEYRQRLMEVFHRTDHGELLTYVVMPKEEEFKSLEDILRQYKYEPRQYGEWIPCKSTRNGQVTNIDYKCSNCSHHKDRQMPYCEICGAIMKRSKK